MVNIENLPKVILVGEDSYALNLHITAWNKFCVGYQYVAGPKEAIRLKKEYNIFSSVVEPDMGSNPIKYGDAIDDIVDVPTVGMAWNVLATRINTNLANGTIKIKF
jgi:hypothetical protein